MVVLDYPDDLLGTMIAVLEEEERERKRAENRAKARRGRKR
jgi:hypothetical protein